MRLAERRPARARAWDNRIGRRDGRNGVEAGAAAISADTRPSAGLPSLTGLESSPLAVCSAVLASAAAWRRIALKFRLFFSWFCQSPASADASCLARRFAGVAGGLASVDLASVLRRNWVRRLGLSADLASADLVSEDLVSSGIEDLASETLRASSDLALSLVLAGWGPDPADRRARRCRRMPAAKRGRARLALSSSRLSNGVGKRLVWPGRAPALAGLAAADG